MKKINTSNTWLYQVTVPVTPDLLKSLPILSDTIGRRFVVEMKPYWKSEKKTTVLEVINKFIIYKLFKDFFTERRLIG